MPLLVRRPRLCSSLYSSDHSVGLGWRAKDLKCLPSFRTAALWKVEVFLSRFSGFIYLGPFFSSFEKKHHVVVWCECGHAHARHRVRAEVRQQLWAWVSIFPPWDGVSCSVSHIKLSGIADMGSHTRLHVILGVWDQGIMMIAGESLLTKPSPEPLSFFEMGTLLCSPGWLWACGDSPASASGIWVYLQECFTAPGFIVLLPKGFHPPNGTQSGMGQGEVVM